MPEFGECLWSNHSDFPGLDEENICRTCDREIVDIRGLNEEEAREAYEAKDGNPCVQCSSQQLGGNSWLGYSPLLLVGLLPVLNACDTSKRAKMEAPPTAIEQIPEDKKRDNDSGEQGFIGVVVETTPEIVGGIEALQSEVEYPQEARNKGVEGRVFVQFTVDENGEVSNLSIIRGIGSGCDKEALRVIRNLEFEWPESASEEQREKIRMSLPVTFSLD